MNRSRLEDIVEQAIRPGWPTRLSLASQLVGRGLGIEEILAAIAAAEARAPMDVGDVDVEPGLEAAILHLADDAPVRRIARFLAANTPEVVAEHAIRDEGETGASHRERLREAGYEPALIELVASGLRGLDRGRDAEIRGRVVVRIGRAMLVLVLAHVAVLVGVGAWFFATMGFIGGIVSSVVMILGLVFSFARGSFHVVYSPRAGQALDGRPRVMNVLVVVFGPPFALLVATTVACVAGVRLLQVLL